MKYKCCVLILIISSCSHFQKKVNESIVIRKLPFDDQMNSMHGLLRIKPIKPGFITFYAINTYKDTADADLIMTTDSFVYKLITSSLNVHSFSRTVIRFLKETDETKKLNDPYSSEHDLLIQYTFDSIAGKMYVGRFLNNLQKYDDSKLDLLTAGAMNCR